MVGLGERSPDVWYWYYASQVGTSVSGEDITITMYELKDDRPLCAVHLP